jgi:predicted transcriptional regulator
MENPMSKSHGRTLSGVELTDDVLEQMALEAEQGLDPARLRRRPGRPAMGDGPASALPVRLDPELREALDARAASENTTASHVVREALRQHLRVDERKRGATMASERTGKKAASSAGKTVGASKGSRAAKSAAGSALSQRKSSGVTGKKAGSNASATLRASKSTKAAKSAAGSALTQRPSKGARKKK